MIKVVRRSRNLFNSRLSFEVPSQGNRVLKSDGTETIRRGWIEVHAETGSVSGLLTYRHIQTGIEVAVEPVALGNHFALFVEGNQRHRYRNGNLQAGDLPHT